MVSLRKEGSVFVLSLGDTENRFNPDSMAAISRCLDEVERAAEASSASSSPAGAASPSQCCGLVTTAGGRFFSNGLDIDWLMSHKR